MQDQTETTAALRFLGRVLVSADARAIEYEEPWLAAGILAASGDRGLAVLRRAHAQDLVHDPAARQYLSELARTDFRP